MRRTILREALRASLQARTQAAVVGGAGRAANQIAQLAEAGAESVFSRRLDHMAALCSRAPIVGARLHSSQAEPAPERAAEAGSAGQDTLDAIHDHVQAGEFDKPYGLYTQWKASAGSSGKRLDAKTYGALLIAEGRRRGDAFAKMQHLGTLVKDMRTAGVRPDPQHFDALSVAAAELRSFDLATAVLEGMKTLGVPEGPPRMGALFAGVLAAMKSEPAKILSGYRLLKEARETGAVPRPGSGPHATTAARVRARLGTARLLTALCKREMPAEASECATVLREIGFPVGQASLGEILTSAAEARDVPSILFAAAAIREYKPTPGEKRAAVDQGTAVACLDAAGASAHPEAAQAIEDVWALLLASLAARGLPAAPGPRAFEALVAARAARGDVRGAFEALSEWDDAHPLTGAPPEGWGSLQSLRPLVRAIVASRDADRAYFSLVEMHKAGRRVPAAAVTAVVAACAQLGDMQAAFSTFEELGRTFPARPDTATFNALLEGCIRKGRADAVPSLAAEMEVQGVRGDLDTLTFLMDAARMRGDVEGALALARSRAYSEAEPPPRGALVRLHHYACRDPALREKVEVAAEELGLKLVKTGEGDVSLAH